MKKKTIAKVITSFTILVWILISLMNENRNSTVLGSEYIEQNETPPPIINQQNTEEIIQKEEINDDFIGILEIPKINMRGIIKEGSTSNILQDYIGHIENTPKYDGNICLAAHNRGNQYSYFGRINELEKGDELLYSTRFGTELYKVENIREIDEQDWTLLKNTNESKLTLITCIKDKKEKRLCVQGAKINNKEEETKN